MSALIVAVSQRVDLLPDREERRDALDQRLCIWLIAAGFLPVPVPNRLTSAHAAAAECQAGLHDWLQAVRPGAVVLSSGNDIGACPERDFTERLLLDWAKERRLPLLGICRGMQMLCGWAGGPLKRVLGHVRTRHSLSGLITGEVNSFHDFTLEGCPPDFEVLARAEDGEIEAIRHTNLPWEGWMWHPEREREFTSGDLSRVNTLFTG